MDPRTRDLLSSDDDYENSMITEQQYCIVKKDVVDLMFERTKEMNTEKEGDQDNEQNQATDAKLEPVAAVSPVLDMQQLMWSFTAHVKTVTRSSGAIDDVTSMLDCERELEGYLKSAGEPIKNAKGDFFNPLSWWENNENLYPVLAMLAKGLPPQPLLRQNRFGASLPVSSQVRGRVLVRSCHLGSCL